MRLVHLNKVTVLPSSKLISFNVAGSTGASSSRSAPVGIGGTIVGTSPFATSSLCSASAAVQVVLDENTQVWNMELLTL